MRSNQYCKIYSGWAFLRTRSMNLSTPTKVIQRPYQFFYSISEDNMTTAFERGLFARSQYAKQEVWLDLIL